MDWWILNYLCLNVNIDVTECRKRKSHTYLKSLQHQRVVLTAFPVFVKLQIAEMRAMQSPAMLCVRCVRAVQSPRTPCGSVCFEHVQINAAAWRLHSILQRALGTLWGLLERRWCVVGVPGARCKDAV